jgi:hypothetical protein
MAKIRVVKVTNLYVIKELDKLGFMTLNTGNNLPGLDIREGGQS